MHESDDADIPSLDMMSRSDQIADVLEKVTGVWRKHPDTPLAKLMSDAVGLDHLWSISDAHLVRKVDDDRARTLSVLREYWLQYPLWRLGQLLSQASSIAFTIDGITQSAAMLTDAGLSTALSSAMPKKSTN